MAKKNNKLKLKIHPLSVVFGCILIVLGYGIELLMYVAVLLIHEYAHFIVASNCGGSLKNTYITPFGAKLEAELFDLKPFDELKVALAGPVVNLIIVLALYALWWKFPSTYPYTETLANINLGIASVNLFPAYPLDGGRVLNVLLKCKVKDKAENIVKIVGIVSGGIFIVIFFLNLKNGVNLTLIMMAIFMIMGGVVDLKRDNMMQKTINGALGGLDIQGKEVKKVNVNVNDNLYQLVGMLDNAYFYEFDAYNNGEKIASFNEIKLKKLLLSNNYNTKLINLLK